jgi:hypothetical protein
VDVFSVKIKKKSLVKAIIERHMVGGGGNGVDGVPLG